MLPLPTVQQSLKQARLASQELRALLHSKTAPSAQSVKDCMLKGAQAQWMSKQGTHAAEHALSIALSKGYSDAVEVILEFEDSLSAPRDTSLYTVALGKRGSLPHPQDFSRCVAALVKHGYSFHDQETVSAPALVETLSSNNLTYTTILLEAGAASAFTDKDLAENTLSAAMGVEGGVDLLLKFAPLSTNPTLADGWWTCALRNARHRIPELTKVVELGLGCWQPSDYAAMYIAKQAPFLMAEMMHQGFQPPISLPLESWDKNGSHEPFWRHVAQDLSTFLNRKTSAVCLNLSSAEKKEGHNWLSYLVKEENWVDIQRWHSKERAEIVRAQMPSALAAGLDVNSRDNEGRTAAWHILSALNEHATFRPSVGKDDPGSPENTKQWLDVLVDFELAAAPVLENGVEVSILEAQEGKLASRLSAHGCFDKVKASIDRFQLKHAAPQAPGVKMVRRM